MDAKLQYFELHTTIFGRLIAKILVDWTFFVQGRHPNEAGGVGLCLSLVSTVVICLA